jgi:uncharacterized membrane protein YfcA
MTAIPSGLAAGFLIAVVTAPAGVSGAVFLLPVQLSVFDVPSPSVAPTNLLFTVVAVPGALLRFRAGGPIVRAADPQLVTGTLPGVVAGAVIRVYAAPRPRVFRIIVAALLLPLGLWLGTRTQSACFRYAGPALGPLDHCPGHGRRGRRRGVRHRRRLHSRPCPGRTGHPGQRGRSRRAGLYLAQAPG